MSEQPNQPAGPAPGSIEGLFLNALEKTDPDERKAFLDQVCGDDLARRQRLEALLRAYDGADSFLEQSPPGVSVTQTADFTFLETSDDPGLLGMLGQYEIIELIGRGGMGVVFRARDPRLNRVVAIKVLAPELAAHPNARLRFLREAQAAAAISHPHVVTIHAVEDHAGEKQPALPFLVMECIVGQTLQQKIDRTGSLRVTEIVRISHQIAEGLVAAHRRGLIHRDIKPANILLENGVERVKITDFGLARAVDDVTITRTGEVSGTPQYMSPEQASGERVDHRSDLFSLGCVMYAMCTGRSPFRATSVAAAIKRVCQDPARPIHEINPEIPDWLVDLIDALLQKDPELRPQSTGEVAQLLEQELAALQSPGDRKRTDAHRRIRPPASMANAGDKLVAVGHPPAESGNVWGKAFIWTAVAIVAMPPLFAALSFTVYLTTGAQIGAGEAIIIGLFVSMPVALIVLLYVVGVSLLRKGEDFPVWYPVACIVLGGPLGLLMFLYLQFVVRGRIERQAVGRELPEHSQVPPADSQSAIQKQNTGAGVTGKSIREAKFRRWGILLQAAGFGLIAAMVAAFVLVTADVIPLHGSLRHNADRIGILAAGLAVLLLLVGGVVYEFGRPKGQGSSPLLWFLLLGPLGIAIWLMRRDRELREQLARMEKSSE
ncbi:MAG: protein kinase [Planctomycetaceae bacterium]|nr:protein kinase [Planctomycetaceae bacterium]